MRVFVVTLDIAKQYQCVHLNILFSYKLQSEVEAQSATCPFLVTQAVIWPSAIYCTSQNDRDHKHMKEQQRHLLDRMSHVEQRL